MTEAFNMDCLEAMAQMKDNEFDLAIVDPPYGIPEAFKGGFASNKSGRKKSPFAQNMIGKTWDENPPKKEYFIELMRVSENQIIWGGNYFIDYLHSTRGIVGWIKPEQANGDHPFFSHFELAWTSFKMPAKIFQKKTTSGNEKRLHPTQKPIALYKWLLKNYAKEGDTILDTHLGSGSSRIAAHDMGFDFTGYEIDKDYFDAQEKRFQNHIKQQSLFKPKDMYQ